MSRLRCGIGIFDRGHHPTTNGKGKQSRIASLWGGMIERCYGPEESSRTMAYKECSVDEKFLRFQGFAEWVVNQIGHDKNGFHLDKDIIIRGNRVYGPETCCFVPREINQLLISNRKNRSNLPVGVHCVSGPKQFAAVVSFKGKNQIIGRYTNVDDAFSAYKVRKEQIIRAAADSFKEHIDPKVYDALCSYRINITD